MSQPLPPWSLQWSSNGELCPLDRQDLFLCLQLPGVVSLQAGPAEPGRSVNPQGCRVSTENLLFPYR